MALDYSGLRDRPCRTYGAVLVWTEFSLLGRGDVHQCGVYEQPDQATADRAVREAARDHFGWRPPRWWQWWRRRDSDHPTAPPDPVRTDPGELAKAVDQLLGEFHGARYREALEELIDLADEWRDRLADMDAAARADPDDLPEPGQPSFRRNPDLWDQEPADEYWNRQLRDDVGGPDDDKDEDLERY